MVDKVNAALKQYIDAGAWKQALDKTVGPSGYDIPDPPTPGSCLTAQEAVSGRSSPSSWPAIGRSTR